MKSKIIRYRAIGIIISEAICFVIFICKIGLVIIFIYSVAVLIILFLAFLLASYFVTSIISFIYGSPFVPISRDAIKELHQHVRLKRKSRIAELGSGDGRFLMEFCCGQEITGVGIEINPLLFLYSSLKVRIRNCHNVLFMAGDFFKFDLSGYDLIYFFLLPSALKKLSKKLAEECKIGCIIVSHGFQIPDFESYLEKELRSKAFDTYIYRISGKT